MIYSVLSSMAKESGGVPIAVHKRFNKLVSDGYEATILTISYQKKFTEFVEWFYENKKIDRNIKVLNLIDEIENLVDINFLLVDDYEYNDVDFLTEEKISSGDNVEYINYKKNDKLVYREEIARGKIRAIREYYTGYHYLTIVNNDKLLLKVKLTKGIWSNPIIPGLNHDFDTMQELYKYLLSLKILDGDVIFSEFRDTGLPYLHGGGLDGIIASLDGKIRKIAFIHTTHLHYPYNNVDFHDDEYVKLFQNYKSFDKLVVLTKEQQKDIQKSFKVKNLVVLPHSFPDTSHIKKDRNENEITVITRLATKKNFNLVLDIQEEIQKRDLPFYINVYGKVASLKDYPGVSGIIEQKKLNINIKGVVHNIDEVLSTSRCLLVTSIGEGQCMCLYESLACHTPVVTSNFKYGTKDVVKNNKNGYIININNPKEVYISEFVDAIINIKNINYKEENYNFKHLDENDLYTVLIENVLGVENEKNNKSSYTSSRFWNKIFTIH